MRSVELPQVLDTSTASVACDVEWGTMLLLRLRAAVEACTQGVLGPLIICDCTKLLLLSDDQCPNNSSVFSHLLSDFSPGSGDIPRL